MDKSRKLFLIGNDCMMVMDNREKAESLNFTSVFSQKEKKWTTDQSEGAQ